MSGTLRKVPFLGAVAAAGEGVLAGQVIGVAMAVAFLLVRRRERRFSGGNGRSGGKQQRRSLLSVRDAAVAGDRRHERRVSRRDRRRDAEALLGEMAVRDLRSEVRTRLREV